jgi:hypothetical protein
LERSFFFDLRFFHLFGNPLQRRLVLTQTVLMQVQDFEARGMKQEAMCHCGSSTHAVTQISTIHATPISSKAICVRVTGATPLRKIR